MAWDYAELSKMAKDNGGPEELLKKIEENARSDGQASMIPWVVIAAVVSPFVVYGVKKLDGYIKEKRAITQANIDEAKAELVHGINDYDNAHSEDNEDAALERGEENDE